MGRKGYILLLGFMLVSVAAYCQKSERDYLRSGNKLYKDSTYVKAEVDYRKALELEPKSTDAMYNLANSLLMQQKAKEAMEQYEAARHVEKDKMKLAQIYHNMGVILQSSKQLPQCIEAYKEALRNNQQNKDQQDQQKKDQQQQNQQQQQQQQNQMSKENAEQLLRAAMQDEKNVQDKVKKGVRVEGRKLEKDW